MLTLDAVKTLLLDLESDRVERTVATDKPQKFSEAICAFANDYPRHEKPGYLMIGAHDDGTLSGMTVSDELMRNLAGIRSDGNILPQPAMVIEKVSLPEGDLLVIEVQPSFAPPVRYKGRIYIRVGPRKAIANEQEELRLSEKRNARLMPFDTSPLPESAIADLSLRLFEEYRHELVSPEVIAENHRSTEQKLASLRCFDLKAQSPTVAGLLLFGTNPLYFLPGAYVQFLRFPGKDMTDRPEDELSISGDLRTVLETMRQKIVGHNKTALEQGEGFQDRSAPDYPEWALRELLHNAVMHRNYQSNTPIRFYWFSDRIEIQSPGGLYGEVTPATLESRNSYRNPVIAEALKAMGYVNRYGYGIQRAKQFLQDNGNPPPRFEVDDQVFLVTLYRKMP